MSLLITPVVTTAECFITKHHKRTKENAEKTEKNITATIATSATTTTTATVAKSATGKSIHSSPITIHSSSFQPLALSPQPFPREWTSSNY